MTARDWLYERLTRACIDPELVSAELAAFREEVIAEVAVADGRVLASVRPSEQRDADRIADLEKQVARLVAQNGELRDEIGYVTRRCRTTAEQLRAVDAERDADRRTWAHDLGNLRDAREELAVVRAERDALAARPTWSEAADEAEDVALTLHHHHKIEQENGAHEVVAKLREKAAEAGEGRRCPAVYDSHGEAHDMRPLESGGPLSCAYCGKRQGGESGDR